MTAVVKAWELMRVNTLIELKSVYRTAVKWIAQRSIGQRLGVLKSLRLARSSEAEVLGLCRDFYFKIWHDCGVMHLFAIDCISSEYRSALDVGCGTALNAPLITLKNPQCHYTGIDANEIAITVGRKHMPTCRLIAGDFMGMNIRPRRYDIVICLSVLEHTLDFEHMISKVMLCAKYEVVLGFYRGLSQTDQHLIQPVPTKSFWEPKYGNGVRRWEFSYLNTYSEIRLKNWLLDTFPDWEFTFTQLYNAVLKEFPNPMMVHLKRKTQG